MRKIVFVYLLAIILAHVPSVVMAQSQEVMGHATYTMGDGETRQSAEQQVLTQAKRDAAEKVGVYVESYTKVINAQVSHDEIETISAAVLRIKDKSFNWSMTPTTDFYVECHILAEVDDANIERVLKQAVDKRKQTVQTKVVYVPSGTPTPVDNPVINSLIAQGEAYEQRDEYEQAAKIYQQVVKLDPKHFKANVKMITAESDAAQYGWAVKDAKKLLEMYPNSKEAMEVLGVSLFNAGKYDQARQMLLQAIKNGSNTADIFAKIGFCYVHDRNFNSSENNLNTLALTIK